MFEIKDLAGMFKLITKFDFVLGGLKYSPNFVRGVCIASLINSEVCASQVKHFSNKPDEKGLIEITETSIIQYNFQIDIYKENSRNAKEIEAYSEALRVRELLKSWQVDEYLKVKNAEILPNYSIIQTSGELVENKLINRAFFDFSIISKISVFEKDKYADRVEFISTTLQ